MLGKGHNNTTFIKLFESVQFKILSDLKFIPENKWISYNRDSQPELWPTIRLCLIQNWAMWVAGRDAHVRSSTCTSSGWWTLVWVHSGPPARHLCKGYARAVQFPSLSPANPLSSKNWGLLSYASLVWSWPPKPNQTYI